MYQKDRKRGKEERDSEREIERAWKRKKIKENKRSETHS